MKLIWGIWIVMIAKWLARQADKNILTATSFFLAILFGISVFLTFHSETDSMFFYIGLILMTIIMTIWVSPAAIAFGIVVWLIRLAINA